MKIAVVGQGYVGLNLSLAAFSAGHKVIGIEVSKERLEDIRSSVPYPIRETFEELAEVEIVIIAVPTPIDEEMNPDLSFLVSASNSIGKAISSKPTLIINESTSYPGTLRNIIAPIIGGNHLFASAPERVDPGNEVWTIRNTPRLVSGITMEATKLAVNFYRTLCEEIIEVSKPEVAEAAKLLENTYRLVNISLVHEFSKVAHTLDFSIHEAISAASTKPFGFMPFYPSTGAGGHCIPIDPVYLSYVAKINGIQTKLVDAALEINMHRPKYIAQQIAEFYNGNLKAKTIQIIGIAYKKDVSDLRESSAIALMQHLRELGAIVSWHDPLVLEWQDESSSPIREVDLGVICTLHQEIDLTLWRTSNMNVLNLTNEKILNWGQSL